MTFDYDYIRRSDLVAAAKRLGVPLAVVKAVATVEARRTGFIKGTDLPKILFEGHHFSKRTGRQFDAKAPTISYRTWTSRHYKGGRGEYARLSAAIELTGDVPDAALLSTSWGMFQIMGFNHRLAGYDSVSEFVDWMATGENHHLAAFVSYIENRGLADELRGQKWAAFARAYNGPGYAKNAYDTKIATAFRAHSLRLQEEEATGAFAMERGDVAELQAALNLQGGAGLATDGWVGDLTRAAIRSFRATHGLPPGDRIDAELCAALGIEMSHYRDLKEAA